MARHYLLAGYIIPILVRAGDTVGTLGTRVDREYCRSIGITSHRNYTVARFDARTYVRAVFFKWARGVFMINAPSRRIAYRVADAIQGYFSLLYGYEPDHLRQTFYLLEMDHVPQPDWTEERLIRELQRCDPAFSVLEIHGLEEGFVLSHDHLEQFASVMRALVVDERLREGLVHFQQSRFLFYGYMVGSYYHFHYARDRAEAPRWLMEKRYFEERARYELAFVAAFKALECLFGTTQIRKNRLGRLFAELPYNSITPTTIYRRQHEIFAGLPASISYRDLVVHFLNFRNAVAAHANRSPPPDFILSEDNLFEIQRFVSLLIMSALKEAVDAQGAPPMTLPVHDMVIASA